MKKITNRMILALIKDGLCSMGIQRPQAVSMGLLPQNFGDDGYISASRLEAIGLDFDDLARYNLALQSESHAALTSGIMSDATVRIAPENRVNEQQRRRDNYARQHGGVYLRPIWTGQNCPGGLRLKETPDSIKAVHAKQWAAQVVHNATNGDPDAEFVVPAIFVPSTGALVDPTVTGLPVTPRGPGRPPKASVNSAPPAFTTFGSAWTTLRTAMTNVLGALRSGDDQALLAPYIAEAQTLHEAMESSSLGKLGPAAFDATAIRSGVEVVLLNGSPVLKAAQVMCKARLGLDVAPEATPFIVVRPRMQGDTLMGWELQPKDHPALAHPLFAPLNPLPIKRIVRTVVAPTTWKAEPGALGYLGANEIYIDSVNGDKASVFFTDPDVQAEQGHEEAELFEIDIKNIAASPTA